MFPVFTSKKFFRLGKGLPFCDSRSFLCFRVEKYFFNINVQPDRRKTYTLSNSCDVQKITKDPKD